jgi:hypothetical protein
MAAASAPTNVLDTIDFGQVPGTGPTNREDLQDFIANVDYTDTPYMAIVGRVEAKAVRHDWQEQSLRDPKLTLGMTTTSMVTGVIESADFLADQMTIPVHKENYVQEFRGDYQIGRREIVIAQKGGAAGITDVVARESDIVRQELLRAVEARIFSTKSTGGTATGTITKMKTLDNESTAPTETGMLVDYGGISAATDNIIDVQSAGTPGTPTEAQFQQVIRAVRALGGKVTDIFVSLGWKDYIALQFAGYGDAATPINRNGIADNMLVSVVDYYRTQHGTARIHGSLWVTTTGEKETNSDSAGTLSGRIWMLDRSLHKVAWLDPFHTEVMGKRGTSVAMLETGTCTIEVRSGKQGKIKSVADQG